MNEVGYFAVKSIGLSRLGGRKPCTLLVAARHNLREIQAERGAVGRINAARTRCNLLLAGPATAKEVEVLAASLLAAAGVNADNLRKDHAQAIEAVFSLPPGHSIDHARYFAACLDWLRAAMRLPVLSATVHNDEGAPHMHALLLPLQGGAHVGSKPIQREEWQRLCQQFFEAVAGPAGLQRPGAKLHGSVKKWAVDAVLSACGDQGLPGTFGALWPVLVAAVRRDPMPAMKALGITLDSVRPAAGDRLQTQSEKHSTGFDANPYGFSKIQTQFYVGSPSPIPCRKYRTGFAVNRLFSRYGAYLASYQPPMARTV